MTVYIELLIIDNFALDMLIGYVALLFLKVKIRFKQLLLSAAIGTGFAVALPFIPFFLSVPYKLLALALSVLPLRKYPSKKDYLATLIVYALVSALLAGIMVLIFNMKASSLVNTFVYDKGGAIGVIAVGAVLVLYGARQLIGLAASRRLKDSVVNVDITSGDITVSTKGLVDTGNRLSDENGRGVIILGRALSDRFDNLQRKAPIKIITVNGESVFETVEIEKILIYYEDKSNTINCVRAVLSKRAFEGYEVILFAKELG